MAGDDVQKRLDYLRGEIEAERINYSEIAELQGLAPFIKKDDVLLREWAGIPEFDETPVEIRIVVSDAEGTVIDMVECTRADLLDDIKRHPHGLLSAINQNLI